MQKLLWIIAVAMLACGGTYFYQLNKARNTHGAALEIQELIPAIGDELQLTKSELLKNKTINQNDVQHLITKLDDIYTDLATGGQAVRKGKDEEWRRPFVIFQSIIETVLAKAKSGELDKYRIDSCDSIIVTPRMPSPLMLDKGKVIEDIDLSKPSGVVDLRRHVLAHYFKAGCSLYAYYSKDAPEIFKDDHGYDIYKAMLSRYKNLHDQPVLNIEMKDFPVDKTGAMYYINGNNYNAITVGAYQVSQLALTQARNVEWSIKVGANAASRLQEMYEFISPIAKTKLDN